MASLSIARADPLGNLRIVARIAGMVAALLICLPLHLIFRLFRLPSPVPRLFLGSVARICGAIVSTEGQRIRSDVFYVANHLSWIDVCILAGTSGSAFVSQDGIEAAPIVGWLASLNNTVFVSRTDRLSVGSQVAELRDALAAKQPITIFPEGTTTDGRSLLPFKPALFAVMTPPPRPMMVQPVLIDFGDAGPDIAWIGNESGLDNTRRLLARPGGFRVTVKYLEPFDPALLPDRKAIAREARERIRVALSASLGGQPVL
jgi:1-acyl-sn-glycerol-3-phosphate acyltransferase